MHNHRPIENQTRNCCRPLRRLRLPLPWTQACQPFWLAFKVFQTLSPSPEEEGSNSSSDFQSDDDYAWIPWFCSLRGNEFFCEVEDSYVQDSFNLTGLNQTIPYYEYALDMVLDIEPTEVLMDDQQELVENDAENLFGLIHARYILTERGLQSMLDKYRQCHFGRCPRVLCVGQPTLPVGVSDAINQESVKLYCPKCEDIYHSKSSRHEHIDGAYFGTTFAHLFFLSFPEFKGRTSKEKYVPRVFGFRVNKSAYKRSLEARKQQKKEQPAAIEQAVQ